MNNSPDSVERPVHGALDYAELARLHLQPEEMLDFSVNAQPYGPSPHVREAIANVALDRYPDRECLQLRQAVLDYELANEQVTLSSLVCGNGASELIWTIARTYLQPGSKAAIVGPTFGEYSAACRAVAAEVVELRAQAATAFQLDMAAVCTWIQAQQPSVVWLCNPNNPTGTYLSEEQLVSVVEICQSVGALLVIDESYKHFVVPADDFSALEFVRRAKAVLVLRSLTKDFALAGLRLGYVVGAPAMIKRLGGQLPSWNVSAIAQAAGCAALADCVHLTVTLNKLAQEREKFFHALLQSGLRIMPSRTHFCLVVVGDARQVRQRLLLRKIVVRDCTSFGLPTFIRVATRPTAEWQRLLQALREVV